MKKICLILTLVLLCTMLFSCDKGKTKDDEKETVKVDNLLKSREKFKTTLIENKYKPDGAVDKPPAELLVLTKYKSDDGELEAYITPEPKETKKMPAILWAHASFGGIDSWLYKELNKDRDQSVVQFLKKDMVVMCPSWRAENKNPGKFELFYGEVNDLLNALKYLQSLDYVDKNRIYLAGNNSGGTLSLLAATATDEFRAIFSMGGTPDIYPVVSINEGKGFANTPFDYKNKDESFYRSAINFTEAIKTPTFHFDGEQAYSEDDVLKMKERAEKANIPFYSFIVDNSDQYKMLGPLKELILKKILADSGEKTNIKFDVAEIGKLVAPQKVEKKEVPTPKATTKK